MCAKSKYSLLYDEAQKLGLQLATDVSSTAEMKQRLINARKDVLGYMDALHLKAVMSQNTIKESFCGNFASLVQRLQTVFMLEVAAVPKSAIDSGREALIHLRRSILKREMAAMDWLDRLIGGGGASPETGAAVPEAGRTGGASSLCPSK